MKILIGLAIGAVAFALALVAVGALVAPLLGVSASEYWSGTLPTFVGILAGLPLALLLADVGARLAAARERTAARLDALERERVVLGLIRDELRENNAELDGDRAQRPRPVVLPFLRDDTWTALKDGGDIATVDDPQLIAKIARAYHRIGTITLIEQELYQLLANPLWRTTGWQTIPDKNPWIQLDADARDQGRHAIAAVDVALEALSVKLDGASQAG